MNALSNMGFLFVGTFILTECLIGEAVGISTLPVASPFILFVFIVGIDLMACLFRRKDQGHLEMEKKRGKMTLFHVMALKELNKGSIRPVDYGVLGLKKGARGYGDILFLAKFRPGYLSSLKRAQALCREAARSDRRFDLLFIDDAPRSDKVNVLCPRCKDYWAWDEVLENDLRHESGRLCPECRKELSQSNRGSLGSDQAGLPGFR